MKKNPHQNSAIGDLCRKKHMAEISLHTKKEYLPKIASKRMHQENRHIKGSILCRTDPMVWHFTAKANIGTIIRSCRLQGEKMH